MSTTEKQVSFRQQLFMYKRGVNLRCHVMFIYVYGYICCCASLLHGSISHSRARFNPRDSEICFKTHQTDKNSTPRLLNGKWDGKNLWREKSIAGVKIHKERQRGKILQWRSRKTTNKCGERKIIAGEESYKESIAGEKFTKKVLQRRRKKITTKGRIFYFL